MRYKQYFYNYYLQLDILVTSYNIDMKINSIFVARVNIILFYSYLVLIFFFFAVIVQEEILILKHKINFVSKNFLGTHYLL